jgi:hypothetical protein
MYEFFKFSSRLSILEVDSINFPVAEIKKFFFVSSLFSECLPYYSKFCGILHLPFQYSEIFKQRSREVISCGVFRPHLTGKAFGCFTSRRGRKERPFRYNEFTAQLPTD